MPEDRESPIEMAKSGLEKIGGEVSSNINGNIHYLTQNIEKPLKVVAVLGFVEGLAEVAFAGEIVGGVAICVGSLAVYKTAKSAQDNVRASVIRENGSRYWEDN